MGMAFELASIDFDDISRMQKQAVRSDVALAPEMVNPEDPLKGVVREQRNRNSEIGDVLNIGSGTRCKHCGMLHFMWRENCGSCGKPMEYNLGHRDEGARE
tara:strand:- start:458 stop:760 length:303 start_codon:yes stop_codon:yes gene_type:complete